MADDHSNTTDRQPAEVFHPSFIITEEMIARGWTRHELAQRMGGDYRTKKLEIELYFEIGPTQPNLRIGDGEDFAKAFGVPAEYFRNLETAWLKAQGGATVSDQPDSTDETLRIARLVSVAFTPPLPLHQAIKIVTVVLRESQNPSAESDFDWAALQQIRKASP